MSKPDGPLSPKEADTLMTYVLDHYMKHYDAVLRKLGHAKSATRQSISDIHDENKAPSGGDYNELKEIQAYEGMWQKVIDLFACSGVSEDELQKIEIILNGLPHIIDKYYKVLVQQDEILQALIEELGAEKYQNAIARTKKIQSVPDLMSGLDPSEYDLGHVHKHAFMFKVPASK
ncbi:MAG: hypothetical protein H6867_08385 [Rhodospirillales bacterium]|nr:hypothetical protein [Rhodospirillales bacterium]MCB9995571.1 hypothetical protein [Rhodospirillales bacterium]